MESLTEYDDGYDDEVDLEELEDLRQLLADIREVVDGFGSLVAEVIDCHHCNYKELAFHPFAESLECPKCGKRNASNVPIYHDVEDILEEPEELEAS